MRLIRGFLVILGFLTVASVVHFSQDEKRPVAVSADELLSVQDRVSQHDLKSIEVSKRWGYEKVIFFYYEADPAASNPYDPLNVLFSTAFVYKDGKMVEIGKDDKEHGLWFHRFMEVIKSDPSRHIATIQARFLRETWLFYL